MVHKIATSILLVALVPGAFWTEPNTRRPAGVMFPDGHFHDFGTVRQGTRHRCTFRIVNTTDVPLRILDVRCGGPKLPA